MMQEKIHQKYSQPSIETALKLLLILLVLFLIINFTLNSHYTLLIFYCTFFILLLLLIRIQDLNIKKIFNIKKINCQLVILSILIGGTSFFIGDYLSNLTIFLLNLIGKQPEIKLPQNAFELFCFTLCVVILAPICEELLFRGYFLNAFKKFGIVQAIVFSSLLFGIYHLAPYSAIDAGLFGLVAGYLLYRTGSIFSCILAHGAGNALNLLLMHYFNFYKFSIYDTLHLSNIIVFPAVLLVILLLTLLKKQTPFIETDKKRFNGFWDNIKSLFHIWAFNLIILIFAIFTFLYLFRAIAKISL